MKNLEAASLIHGHSKANLTQADNNRVSAALQEYADRGVFRGLTNVTDTPDISVYHVIWHFNRRLAIAFDYNRRSITVRNIFPNLPQDSQMYRSLLTYVARFKSRGRPNHRRITSAVGLLECVHVGENVSLRLELKRNDYALGVRKIVLAIHELFRDFLLNGPYYEYQVEHLGLDPDTMFAS
jgi:hypothetical protein